MSDRPPLAASTLVPGTKAARSLDAIGMFLSALCLVHCLALPLLLALLPLGAAAAFADERFHLWMLLAVVPVSAAALGFACAKRKAYGLAAIGAAGVVLIGIAALGRETLGLGEPGDRWITTAGVLLLAGAHLANFLALHAGHGHFRRASIRQ